MYLKIRNESQNAFSFMNNKIRERKKYIVLLNKLEKSALFINVNKSGNNFCPCVKILSLLSDYSLIFNVSCDNS